MSSLANKYKVGNRVKNTCPCQTCKNVGIVDAVGIITKVSRDILVVDFDRARGMSLMDRVHPLPKHCEHKNSNV